MAALLDAKNRSATANGKNMVFSPDAAQPAAPTGKATTRVVVGRKASLAYASVGKFLPAAVGAEVWAALVAAAPGGDGGGSTSTLAIDAAGGAATVCCCVLPEACSRHNSPVRGYAITSLAGAAAAQAEGDVDVVVVLEEAKHAAAAGCAVARALPLYSAKRAKAGASAAVVRVAFATAAGGALGPESYAACAAAADGVRLAALLVDLPPCVLTTTHFTAVARDTAERVGATVEVIRGEALRDAGYGGLWGVGKAAEEPPALVVLTKTFANGGGGSACALVGKGIVFDTGGLSIKATAGMCGMKMDCGGAAACLASFEATCALGGPAGFGVLHCVLCLAENAVGPASVRNDDVIRFISGATCEVNNTDAEGRLVLADGVGHAHAKLGASTIIDMATLTGAQMIACGKKHAGVFASTDDIERRAVAAGKRSGDLCHPLVYCPEFHRGEFKSKVADSKNSVKDRMNAQASCAGNFIFEAALANTDFDGHWIHIDLAGPAMADDRGTGFGVALVLALLEVPGFEP